MRNIRIFLAAFLIIGPMTAQADVITISGQGASDGQWNVTTIVGTFNGLSGTLTSQEWWGSQSLASAFASALGGGLGYPNFSVNGPYFVYANVGGFINIRGRSYTSYAGNVEIGINGNATRTFAVATRVPEPGTLALLGIGLLGMGLARRKKTA